VLISPELLPHQALLFFPVVVLTYFESLVALVVYELHAAEVPAAS